MPGFTHSFRIVQRKWNCITLQVVRTECTRHNGTTRKRRCMFCEIDLRMFLPYDRMCRHLRSLLPTHPLDYSKKRLHRSTRILLVRLRSMPMCSLSEHLSIFLWCSHLFRTRSVVAAFTFVQPSSFVSLFPRRFPLTNSKQFEMPSNRLLFTLITTNSTD